MTLDNSTIVEPVGGATSKRTHFFFYPNGFIPSHRAVPPSKRTSTKSKQRHASSCDLVDRIRDTGRLKNYPKLRQHNLECAGDEQMRSPILWITSIAI
jgi:hypothetical protein